MDKYILVKLKAYNKYRNSFIRLRNYFIDKPFFCLRPGLKKIVAEIDKELDPIDMEIYKLRRKIRDNIALEQSRKKTKTK